jgi:hypothetical protein
MKKYLAIFCLVFVSLSFSADTFNSPFQYFFKPRPIVLTPPVSTNKMMLVNPKGYLDSLLHNGNWEFKPISSIAALKISKGSQSLFSPAFGIGVTAERSVVKDSLNYSTYSISVLAFISDSSVAKTPVNFSPAATIGFLNNHLQVGAGYDFKAPTGSRFFGLIGYGLNITLNKYLSFI